jgi:hypothetical protein
MKHNTQDMHYPDHESVPSSLTFRGTWDSEAVYELIRSKCGHGETPAYLLLGKKEADLLRSHLARAFGEEAVTTLKGTHYMGLEVVEIQCESFVATNGRKTSRTLQDPVSRRPAWRDHDSDGMWQFRM